MPSTPPLSNHALPDMKQLQKELANRKQEGQALMTEMESTAQAYEDMQEQNIRLLQQLKVNCSLIVRGTTRLPH